MQLRKWCTLKCQYVYSKIPGLVAPRYTEEFINLQHSNGFHWKPCWTILIYTFTLLHSEICRFVSLKIETQIKLHIAIIENGNFVNRHKSLNAVEVSTPCQRFVAAKLKCGDLPQEILHTFWWWIGKWNERFINPHSIWMFHLNAAASGSRNCTFCTINPGANI